MSTNSQDQEIDLGQVFKKIGNFFKSLIDSLFDVILFIKKNIVVLAILFIIGAAIGFYLDKTNSFNMFIKVNIWLIKLSFLQVEKVQE